MQPQPKPTFLTSSLHILVLFGFAVAQPMFSLLSGYAEFFVARQSQHLDLILLAVVLCLALPSLLILLNGIARMVGSRASEWVHASLIAVLTATILLQVLQRLTAGPGVALVVAAAILGVIGSVSYVRSAPVRTYLTFLSPAILLFPSMFFLNSGIYKIVLPEQVAVQLGIVNATAPVVMIVFDEFPWLPCWMKTAPSIQSDSPNIARLAAESYWFRNATSVSDSTLMSVPAILSGLSPQLDDPRIPTHADYPNTLFTLLGGSDRFEVIENGTQLSPGTEVRQNLRQRMKSLLSDLTIVYAHVLLPSDLTSVFRQSIDPGITLSRARQNQVNRIRLVPNPCETSSTTRTSAPASSTSLSTRFGSMTVRHSFSCIPCCRICPGSICRTERCTRWFSHPPECRRQTAVTGPTQSGSTTSQP